jgi:16S rRNA (guanine1207-N2)-methyltransferase
MNSDSRFGLFGVPDPECVEVPAGVMQFSPLIPGAAELETIDKGSLAGMVMVAPPGTVERNAALALSLRALKPGAPFTVTAPKAKGGSRIARELEAFGCRVEESSRRHQRICRTTRPDAVDTARIDAAIAAGAPCFVEAVKLWSQPGIFSWDRIDPGTALLLAVLPRLDGRGADLGCGIGILARAVLTGETVTHLDLVDIDRRAVQAAERNIVDSRAAFHWADVRTFARAKDLDFVVMNPPFHDGGLEDRALGQAFVRQSHRCLREGGTAWLVANRHLPYEAGLVAAFSSVTLKAEHDGFKVYEAQR